MLVEGLQEENFKAVRIAAGDSVSLAISDLGEVRCWGSFRVRYSSFPYYFVVMTLLRYRRRKESSASMARPGRPRPNSSPSRSRTSTSTRSSRLPPVMTTSSPSPQKAKSSPAEMASRTNSAARSSSVRPRSSSFFNPAADPWFSTGHKTHGLTPERLSLRNIVTIGSGSYHSFAVSAKGDVYAWGLNSFRQTGVSDALGGWADTISSPTIVSTLAPALHGGARVVEITGGVHHSVFLFSNGEVWACGRCDGHEVGLGSEHPEMIKSEERKREALEERAERQVVELDALETAGMDGDEAARKAAEAAAQGVPLPNPHIPEPQRLEFPREDGQEGETRVIKIASGTRHNFAVSSDGRVFAWGVGNTSQLGLGDEEEAETPTRVQSVKMQGTRAVAASTGGQHSVIVAVRQ